MKKVQSVDIVHYSQADVFEYLKGVYQSLSELSGGIPDYAAALANDFTAFDMALNQKPVEQQTEQLASLDERADKAYVYLIKQLKLSLEAPSAACREAAERILKIITAVDDPTGLEYTEEYTALKPIVAQIKALGDADLTVSLAKMWFDELAAAVQAFIDLYNALQRAAAATTAEAIKSAKLRSIISYGGFVEALNARLLMASTPELEAMADKMNASLERLKKTKK